jgi:hypothetical protein
MVGRWKAGWYSAAVLLSVSAVFNAVAIINAVDMSGRLARAALCVTLGLLAALCLRKGMAEDA